MAARGTIQRIADECAVDHKTVRRALEGASLKAGRGGYDFAAGVAAVKAIADPARVIAHAVTRGYGGNGSEYSNARAHYERLRAQKLEIENRKLEGDLISREAVTATCISIIATGRTALLSVGNRAAEKVANKSDVREIARLIESEIRDVLGALGDEHKFLAALEAEALS